MKKVMVIGAGFAGLTAAFRLKEAGVDVSVYEARNRVGGRVFSVGLKDQIVELGGQSIADGGEAPHIHKLLKELKLQTMPNEVEATFSFYDGRDIFSNMMKKTPHQELKKKLKELAKTSQNMEEVLKGLFQEDDPLYRLFCVRLKSYEGGYPKQLSPIYINTLYHMMMGHVSSVYAEEECATADLLSIRGGNDRLAKEIALRMEGNIHLEKVLKRIEKTENGSYLVTFNNAVEKADILILAIPSSVYSNIEFVGNVVPKDRLYAMQQIVYGENAKMVIHCDKEKLSQKGCVCNDYVIGTHYQKTIVLYYTGKETYFCPETIKSQYKNEHPMLKMHYGDLRAFEQSPVHIDGETSTLSESIIGYSWPKDPYALGSYSYIASGQEKILTEEVNINGEKVRKLFSPIENRLYFAGEHTTTSLDVLGTMEAAVESGEKAAKLLLQNL